MTNRKRREREEHPSIRMWHEDRSHDGTVAQCISCAVVYGFLSWVDVENTKVIREEQDAQEE